MKNTSPNRPTSTETYRLCRWLEDNLPRLHRRQHKDIADEASAALRFHATDNNIVGACKAAGIRIEPYEPPIMSDSYSRLNFLAYAVIELYEKLNEDVPDYLRGIAHNKPAVEITALYNKHKQRG